MTYLEYWGLRKKPFAEDPEPEFIYPSRQLEEAVSRLSYAVKRNKGAVLLTGERGCGKTLALASLAENLPPETDIALVTGSALKPAEFLLQAALRFGYCENTSLPKADLLHILHSRALQSNRKNKEAVLLIDDAGVLPKETLEEIRLLMNFQTDDRFLLTIILAGEPHLRDTIREMKQLDQRIAMRCRLKPMDFDDTSGYIISRLKASGATRRIFTFEAMVEIHGYTAGIPMAINDVCERCLDGGFRAGAASVGIDVVHNVTGRNAFGTS